MAEWFKLASALLAVGFQLSLFSTALFNTGLAGENEKTSALVLSGFVAYCLAVMIVIFIHLGAVTQQRVITIILIIGALTAGILPMAGLGVYIDETNDSPPKYIPTIMCGAAIMAVLAGIFAILGLTGR